MKQDKPNKVKEIAEEIIFEIEDYVGGNIEGLEVIDRMAFTVFLRDKLNQAILSERKRLLEEVEKLQEEVQQETGAFKYDFIFEGIKQIINNSEDE